MIYIGDKILVNSKVESLKNYNGLMGTIVKMQTTPHVPNIYYFIKMDNSLDELCLCEHEFDVINVTDLSIKQFKREFLSEECLHDFKYYTGLIEQFEYCIKCGKKKVYNV